VNRELPLAEKFGAHLADGPTAARYQSETIEPLLSTPGDIVLDFSGVRNANSSFMNALISGLIEKHGEGVLEQLLFKGCNPTIKVLIESAIDLGIQKFARKATA
jgi:hypothetical protein